MKKEFNHLNKNGNPTMVDIHSKSISNRKAIAQCFVELPIEIIEQLTNGDISTKKGPVFQSAIIAGIMAAKKTSDLIPLCHNINLTKCNIQININEENLVRIECTVLTESKTGVEMEALVGANIAALTIYDMCKGFSHEIKIRDCRLILKTGGKSDYNVPT